jgi:hypothetical protein
MRGLLTTALLLWPPAAGAAPLRFAVEPVSPGFVHLDRTYEATGLASRNAVRLGIGAAATWERLTLAGALGSATGTTDFGFFAGPRATLEQRDWWMELRSELPWAWRGFRLQGAAGAGRLALVHHPDRILLPFETGATAVDLPPVHAWTRHLAAEVLHGIGRCDFVLRTSWRFYAMDVASPSGIDRRRVCDVQAGVALRAVIF